MTVASFVVYFGVMCIVSASVAKWFCEDPQTDVGLIFFSFLCGIAAVAAVAVHIIEE